MGGGGRGRGQGRATLVLISRLALGGRLSGGARLARARRSGLCAGRPAPLRRSGRDSQSGSRITRSLKFAPMLAHLFAPEGSSERLLLRAKPSPAQPSPAKGD